MKIRTLLTAAAGLILALQIVQSLWTDVPSHVVWLGVANALLLVVLCTAVIERIERPLARIARHARGIAKGELSSIAVHGAPEIQDVALAFSEMARDLSAQRDRDRSFTDLVCALAAGGEVRAVAAAALRSVVDARGAVGGALWLARDATGELEAVASISMDPGELASAGSAIARDVARSGRIAAVDLGNREARCTLSDARVSSLVVAPITDGSRIFGVLEIASSEKERPGEREELIRALARIGPAIRNAMASEQTVAVARALAEQRAHLETSFEALNDAVILVDASGTIRLSNPAASRLAGGPVVGREFRELAQRMLVSSAGEPTAVEDATIFDTVIGRGQAVRNAIRGIVDGLGAHRKVSINVVPVCRGADVTGFVVAARDITEESSLRGSLARANEELREQNTELHAQEEALRAQSDELANGQVELALRNDELARASRLKSDFLASMSHELRTPLNAVIGFSELLAEEHYGPLLPQQAAVVVDVLAAGRQLLTLISDVLDLSKIEAGRIEVKIGRVDLAEPVSEACNLLRSMAQQKGVTVVNRITERTLFASADVDRVRQVVVNLVSNAVKFTPEGGEVIIEATTQGERHRLSVRDTGIGIAATDIPKLFTPFSQLDAGPARRFPGTGLGLSISRRFVELMGGIIGVESAKGLGSTFFFTLPAAPGLVEAPHLPTMSPPSRARITNLPSARRILVVEDEPHDARVIEGFLSRRGYAVTTVATAEAALAIITTLQPVALVIDLGLPGLSGFGLIECIRSMPLGRDLPIAVLTGRDITEEERKQLALTVQVVAPKGDVSRSQLVSRLEEACLPADFSAWAEDPESIRPPTLQSGVVPRGEESPPIVAPRLTAMPAAPRCSVLLVEDNEVNRRVIRAMLQDLPCDIIEANDAPSGLRAAREHQPAVILMDLQMPETNSLSATAELKRDATTSEIPIIAVTPHAMEGGADRARAAGCVTHITKPIARARLQEAMDVALGGVEWRRDGTTNRRLN